jgi:uncharacterized protein (TIGR03118 family)
MLLKKTSISLLLLAAHAFAANRFAVHNLVADTPGTADHTDPCLVNAWGIVASPTSPFWVSANGSGLSTVYDGNGTPATLQVGVSGPAGSAGDGTCGATNFGPGTPTGIIFNGTTAFLAGASPASFIFSTEDGIIAGWNGAAGKATVILADRSGAKAVYKGLAIATRSAGPLLYAANFGAGSIDVFDGNMAPVTLAGGFRDAAIPAGFAPFNIQNLGGSLYVTYAKQDSARHDDVAGAGNGYVDVFDLNGLLLQRLVMAGPLNSPWGLALAPASFGDFAGSLLVGNFGDGAINAFDPATGKLLGTLQDGTGNAIHISGLWGITFGNGSRANGALVPSGGDANTLYFAAGPAHESHGLLGSVQAAPVINQSVVNAASFTAGISPAAFTAIFGANLSPTTRSWTAADMPKGQLPQQLDGVSVSVGGKPAYVYFVSPSQIDVIAPGGVAAGPATVVVTNNGTPGTSSTAQFQAASPAFFTLGGTAAFPHQYAVATHANGSLVGPANLFPGASTPAKPGETIVLYGTGFGPTSPSYEGSIVPSPAPLTASLQVTIAGQGVAPAFAGLVSPGLYQINVTIPAIIGTAGQVQDVPVTAVTGGATTQSSLFLAVLTGQ